MTKLLLAKDVVESKIDELNKKCLSLIKLGLRPKMCVLLAGENPASVLYVKNKAKLCERVGADFELIKLPENVSCDQFLESIAKMNADTSITGCFVQLPIPKHLSEIDVTELIAPEKDVDGFHGENIVNIYKNYSNGFVPCTPKGIVTMLKHYAIEIAGKHVVIIGRSLIVGKPLSLLLTNLNATVTLCHSHTKDIPHFTQQADIIISAVGKAKYLGVEFINPHKKQIIIDVGINHDLDGKLCGDVNFQEVSSLVAAITPVPGGVGPLTVLSLIENLIIATENILKNRN
jgi:methylenetetrahydrofolate dehydrogenase (NADP+) / methenyltetrahydrofolate cyclohydrolase